MNSKPDNIRFSMDIPKNIHKMLKIKAAAIGKSMRDLLIDSALKQNEESDMKKLIKPENKEILASIKRGLSQEGKITWKDFKRKHGV